MNILKPYGFVFDEAKTAEEALELLRKRRYGLAIIDRKFTGLDERTARMSGDDLLIESRADGNQTPIMILTGYPDDRSLNNDFQNGAVEYMKKPYSRIELAARVRARFHWSETANEVLQSGSLVFNVGSRKLTYHGKRILLQPLQYRIVEELIRTKGRRISKENLITAAYGCHAAVTEQVLQNNLSRINSSFRKAGFERITDYAKGVGYVLAVD